LVRLAAPCLRTAALYFADAQPSRLTASRRHSRDDRWRGGTLIASLRLSPRLRRVGVCLGPRVTGGVTAL